MRCKYIICLELINDNNYSDSLVYYHCILSEKCFLNTLSPNTIGCKAIWDMDYQTLNLAQVHFLNAFWNANVMTNSATTL